MKIACDCSRCREYHKKIIGMTDVNSLNTETRVKAEMGKMLVEALEKKITNNSDYNKGIADAQGIIRNLSYCSKACAKAGGEFNGAIRE